MLTHTPHQLPSQVERHQCLRTQLARVVLISLAMLLACSNLAEASIPIEQVQREWQGRHYFIYGTYTAWPECLCATPAPAFPEDGFYGDLDHNPILAMQLVQSLASVFISEHIYDCFLNTADGTNGIAGLTSNTLTYYEAGDFPTTGVDFDLSNVTTNNYLTCFGVLRGYVERLNWMPCTGAFVNQMERISMGHSIVNCDDAKSIATNAWSLSNWVETISGPAQTEYCWYTQGGEGSNSYTVGKVSRRATLRSAVTEVYPRFVRGKLIAYLSTTPYNAGVGGTTPPVTADSTYQFFDSRMITGGEVYESAYLGNSEPTVSGNCDFATGVDGSGVQGSSDYHGWYLNEPIIVIHPEFRVDSDNIQCGNDSCTSCQGGQNLPGAVTAATGSLDVRVSLGPDSRGRLAGYLYLHSDHPGPSLLSPTSLIYSSPGILQPCPDVGGTILHANVNVSIAADAQGYTLWFTNKEGVFVASVSISSNNNTNQLLITETLGAEGNPRTLLFTYASANANAWTWELAEGGGVRVESRSTVWTGTLDRTDTIVVKNSAGAVATRTTEISHVFPWGLALVQRVSGTGDAAKTNTWDYYQDRIADGSSFGQLRQVTGPGGYWERYQCDALGRLTNKVSGFGANLPGTPDAINRATQVSYASNLITTVDRILNTEVGRTYEIHTLHADAIEQIQTIRCAQANGPVNDAANLTNVIWRRISDYDGGYAWDRQAELRPDGTMSLYVYYSGGAIVATGDANASWADKMSWSLASTLAIADGNLTTVTLGTWGETQSRHVIDIATQIITDHDDYNYNTYDGLHRSHTVTHADQTSESLFYACCGLRFSTNRDGVATEYFYDAARRQVGSERLGVTTTNIVDAAGNVLTRYRLAGTTIREWSAVYDDTRRVLRETNALFGVTQHSYGYPSAGGTSHTNTYPDNSQRVEIYNADGSLQSVTGSATFPVYYSYGVDQDGAWTQETKGSADGGEWVRRYTDTLGRVYKIVHPGNAFSQSFFNEKGQLWKQRDPDGVTTLFGYNGKGERTTNILDMSASNLPLRVRRTETDVLQTSDVWDNAVVRRHRTWELNDASSEVLVNEQWQALNAVRNASIAFGLTNTSETIFNTSNQHRTVTVTTPGGTTTISLYTNGLLASVTRKMGDTQLGGVTYGYDSQGRLFTAADARNGTTTYGYNDADLLTSVTTPVPGDGSPAQTTTAYYDRSLRATNTEFADHTSAYTVFDGRGLPLLTWGSRTYPAGFSYDYAGRMKTMTNWSAFSGTGARVTTWNYDPQRGWLSSKTNADNTLGQVYTHTAAGRIASRTWARGIITTNTFNSAGEIATVNYLNDPASTPGISLNYDRRGRLDTVTQGSVTETLAYDDAGNLLADSFAGGPLSGLSVTNSFDGLLRRDSLSVASIPAVFTQYGYDAASRLTGVTNGTSSVTYGYLENSPLVETVTFGQGNTTRLTTTQTFDALNRLKQISSVSSASSVAGFNYRYDAANQRTNITTADNSRWSFGYDDLGQVTSGKKFWADNTPVAGQQFEYQFDTIGNRQWTKQGGDTNGANLRRSDYYANTFNQYWSNTVPGYVTLLGSATNTATVTANNIRAQRQGDYWWNELPVNNTNGAVYQPLTNLAVLNNGTNADIIASVTGGVFVAQTPQIFRYDADGNLTNDGRFSYVWDSENRVTSFERVGSAPSAAKVKVACQYDVFSRRTQKIVYTHNDTCYSPQSTNRFVYDGWNLVAILDAQSSVLVSFTWGLDLSCSQQGAGGVGGLLSMTVHQGSNAGIYLYCYDGSGNVSALVNATNEAVAARYEYGPFGELLRASGPLARENPFLFSTKFYDWETGFCYYGYRFYDPAAGRWLNRDPLEEVGGMNLYGFVLNSPANYFDSDGLIVEELIHGMSRLLIGDPIKPKQYTYAAMRKEELKSEDSQKESSTSPANEATTVVDLNHALEAMQVGPPAQECKRAAKNVSRHDGPRNFLNNNPEFQGTHEIHHSREWNVLKRYPDIFTPDELNLESMMRPILKGQQLHGEALHRSHIRKSWDAFQRQFQDRFDSGEISVETMRKLINRHAEYIDRMYLGIN